MIKIPTRVLLVDDEKGFVVMLGLRLKDAGEIVTVAHSGMECLKLLKKSEIDVVILDILMPEMDGIVTLRNQFQFSLGGGDHADWPRHHAECGARLETGGI